MDVLTAHVKSLIRQDREWDNEARLQALLDAVRMLEAAARNDLYEFEMQHGSKG